MKMSIYNKMTQRLTIVPPWDYNSQKDRRLVFVLSAKGKIYPVLAHMLTWEQIQAWLSENNASIHSSFLFPYENDDGFPEMKCEYCLLNTDKMKYVNPNDYVPVIEDYFGNELNNAKNGTPTYQ